MELNENMRLLEEREKRRSLGARQKALEILNSEKRKESTNSVFTDTGSSDRNISYAYQLSKGLAGLKSLSLLKELKSAEELVRGNESVRTASRNPGSTNRLEVDLFAEARKCIGLYPVKARHILDFHTGDYEICSDDIPQLHNLRMLAAKEFLSKELKWNEDTEMKTTWSQDRNILWLTLPDENLISSIFKRQVEIGRERIKLLKYIPQWCYERNKELEILCRLEREKNPNLRTKVLLGHRDLKLSIKQKGDEFYKRVSVEYFGKLPGFNLTRVKELTPG